MNKLIKDGDYDARDYLLLMKQHIERRIDVETYRNRFFSMNSKRSLLGKAASVIIQKAYGDADDYHPVVKLDYAIDECALRDRVAKSAVELERLDYRVDEKAES